LRSFSRVRAESMLRALSRWAVVGILAVAVPLVSGCDFLDDMQSWNKKPLTGDRKPVFPNGVPGVATGVPADVVKGYRAPDVQVEPVSAAAESAAAEPARPRSKPQTAKPPAAPSVQQATAQSLQPPAPAKPAKRQATAKPSSKPPPADPNAPARQAAAPASAAQSSGLPGAAPLPWPSAQPSTQPATRPQAAWPGDTPTTVAR
jgi:hypothetical protein